MTCPFLYQRLSFYLVTGSQTSDFLRDPLHLFHTTTASLSAGSFLSAHRHALSLLPTALGGRRCREEARSGPHGPTGSSPVPSGRLPLSVFQALEGAAVVLSKHLVSLSPEVATSSPCSRGSSHFCCKASVPRDYGETGFVTAWRVAEMSGRTALGLRARFFRKGVRLVKPRFGGDESCRS